MYNKKSQQQEQQQKQTLQRHNKHWNVKYYQQLVAAEEDSGRAHGDRLATSYNTIPLTIGWNYDKDNEYDVDNELCTNNKTIENSIIEDKLYIENTTVHTTDNNNMNTITKTPSLTPTTNTIIESSIYSGIIIIKDDSDNNINGKNAAKRKEEAL